MLGFVSFFKSFTFSGMLGFVSFFKSFTFSGMLAFVSVDSYFKSFNFSGIRGFQSVDTCFKSFCFSGKVAGDEGIKAFIGSYLSGFDQILSYFTFLGSVLDAGIVLISFNSAIEKVSRRDGETIVQSKRVNMKYFIFMFLIN